MTKRVIVETILASALLFFMIAAWYLALRAAGPTFSYYLVWPTVICGVALYEARSDSLLYSAYLLRKHSKHGAGPVDSW